MSLPPSPPRRPSLLAKYTALTIFSQACAISLSAQTYTWKNVALSGAGAMVTGIIAHPAQQGLFYIRTDVGGSYRWDASNSKWIPLNDRLTFSQSDYYCCEALAIDPGNVNVVYYAGGIADYQRNGALFKSTDKGATWTQLTGLSLYMDGNGDRRWAGERLVVSPFNSNVVLFGSRKNGLWRSSDGGSTWAQVASIPLVTDGYGVQSIAFDPSTSGKVYAAVSTYGVYMSSDHGATWTPIGGNTSPRRLKVASNGTLWYTTGAGVSKYSATTWTNYSPAGANTPCVALGINPANANDILIAKEKANSSSSIWRTTNGGTTWTPLSYTVASTATWAIPALHNYRPTDFIFDPFNAGTVWGDRWRTTNINASSVAWMQQEAGHEEDVCGAAIAPPTGRELLVGVFDDDGFALNNGLDTYPTKQLGIVGSWNGHTWGMAYQETNPANMVRLGTQNFYGGTLSPISKSTDGGATWNRITTFPSQLFPLACAMSATDPNNIVVICNAKYSSDATGGSWTPVNATNPWRYTTNGGTTWSVVTGLPTPPASYGPWGDNQFFAADHVNGSKYYYMDVDSATIRTTGKIYSSINGGANFSQANPSSPLPADKRWYQLKTRPGMEGDVWACVDNFPSSGRSSDEGLYHSTNNGVTWTKISTVNRAFSFGFGKPPSGTTPALYIYGRINGGTTDSIYRSLDLGNTWTNIQSPANNLSDFPSIIEGSRQTPGQVFVGTGGRGFFYGSIGGSTPYGGTAAPIPGTVQFENYDLGGEGLAYHDTTANNNGGQYRTTEGVDIETCTDSGGGYDLSYTAAGEWVQYTVNAASAGSYTVSFRVASANTGATFHLEDQSGNNLTGAVTVPNTGGWQTWTNVTKTITLPAGQQTLKLVEDTSGVNLNYMTFTLSYAGLPYGGTPASIPGIVEVENFDTGGEGVAYHDSTVNNNGGQYRTAEGVDIETCTDTGGGYDLSYTAAGEWIKYTVNAAAATTYVASFRVASANTGASFHLEDKNGTNLTGPISVPNTGSWTSWTIVTKNVTLPQGPQVLKLVEDTGGFNLNYILFN